MMASSLVTRMPEIELSTTLAKALPAEVIDHAGSPEPSSVRPAVRDEVQGPSRVRFLRDRYRRSGAECSLCGRRACARPGRPHGRAGRPSSGSAQRFPASARCAGAIRSAVVPMPVRVTGSAVPHRLNGSICSGPLLNRPQARLCE